MDQGDFGDALDWLRVGARVCREGWNGKGMWLVLVMQWGFAPVPGGDPLPLASSSTMLPFIAMSTAQGDLVPWLASQTDMLALDWQVAK